MRQENTNWSCTPCGAPHLTGPGTPCVECGGLGRTTGKTLQVAVGVVPTLEGKLKDPTLPSKKKLRLHFFIGKQLNHGTGELVSKDWRMDKRGNRYWEKIRDARGRFVRWVDQKLSAHQGRGSARPPR